MEVKLNDLNGDFSITISKDGVEIEEQLNYQELKSLKEYFSLYLGEVL